MINKIRNKNCNLNKKTTTHLKTIISFLLFLSTSFIVFSQNEKHPIDVQNDVCHENSTPTTLAAIECENEALKSWEIEMNLYLKLIKKKNNAIDNELLIETQKAWLSFNKVNTTLHISSISKQYEGGTLGRISIVTFKKEQLRKRTLELKAFYKELE